MQEIDKQQSYYDQIGFSERVGFGDRPAVLVIDMCRGITEPGKMYIDMDAHMPRIQAINAAARRIGAPVIFTTVAYHKDLADAGMFGKKVPLVLKLLDGTPGTEIDPRLPVEATDHLLAKKFPSAFYGTHLQSMLTGLGVDTTIIVGNSTSGCVRATACDAISGGFRPIVPSDCVADRAPLSHQINLFDMDSKYADVVTSEAVLAYLDGLARTADKVAAE
ncbi:MAG: isochorismatase family protein [Rhodospirillaceae bacterium]|nr:isochorismatase family protein [Rhodospirillaceae bacterium]